MSTEARRAAVAALIRLAESTDYRDRADAGQGLAAFVETPEAGVPLVGLVLDVFGVHARERDTALRQCEALAPDSDERTRHGLDQLTAVLVGIDPVLHPVARG